ncbi:hypothetical protein IFM89_010759, partial [Coptis chinensis]
MGTIFSRLLAIPLKLLCAKSFEDTSEKLKEIESQILRKRNELQCPRPNIERKNEHHRRSVELPWVRVYVVEPRPPENRQGDCT